jgi:SAM-dependent methyltransferase
VIISSSNQAASFSQQSLSKFIFSAMKKEDVWKIYDSNYASEYNERYLLNPFSKTSSVTELSVLKQLLNKDTKWLDLGCGTGYFLSEFPGIQRAGLDISPKMLETAREANPDALFFKEGDFREDNPEWNNEWSLITCMWGAYCYVDSVGEVEKIVENIVNWTKTGGSIFLPVLDIEDLRPNTGIKYEHFFEGVYAGTIAITSVTWSWQEINGKFHQHLVSPPAQHFGRLMQPYFDNIEVVRYPPYMLGRVSRKAILATGKRSAPDHQNPANVKWQDIPAPFVKADGPADNTMTPTPNRWVFLNRVQTGGFWRAVGRKILRK